MNKSGEREDPGADDATEATRWYFEDQGSDFLPTRGRPLGASSKDAISNIDGPVVRNLRLEKRWTQEMLGDEANLSKGTISMIETRPGFRVGRVSFGRLVTALGVEDPNAILINGNLPRGIDLSQPPSTTQLLLELRESLLNATRVVNLLIEQDRGNYPQ